MSFSMWIETPTPDTVEIHTETGRNPRENIPCLHCDNPIPENPVRCPKCKIVRYCTDNCLRSHLTKHAEPCEQYCSRFVGYPRSPYYAQRFSGRSLSEDLKSSVKANAMNVKANNASEVRMATKGIADNAEPARCSSCNRSGPGLRKCSKCKTVSYCDADCQRKHWPEHKKACNDYKENTVRCSSCKKANPAAKKCTKCKTVSYCDAGCQTKHWPVHKVVCGKARQPTDESKGMIKSGGKGTTNAQCFCCKKINPGVKKCSKCMFATYCNAQCQRSDFSRHKLACGNYPKFVEALGRGDPLLPTLHDRDITDMVYPPRIYKAIDVFDTPGSKPVLLEIVGPFHHFCRLAVYVQDVKGDIVHMIFHNKSDEQILLLPETLKEKLQTGNFIRWFYPRWHRFSDGEIGFRIDSLAEMEFIPKGFKPF